MATVTEVERWCPECKKVFTATKVLARRGKEETSTETSCPNRGTAGTLLLER